MNSRKALPPPSSEDLSERHRGHNQWRHGQQQQQRQQSGAREGCCDSGGASEAERMIGGGTESGNSSKLEFPGVLDGSRIDTCSIPQVAAQNRVAAKAQDFAQANPSSLLLVDTPTVAAATQVGHAPADSMPHRLRADVCVTPHGTRADSLQKTEDAAALLRLRHLNQAFSSFPGSTSSPSSSASSSLSFSLSASTFPPHILQKIPCPLGYSSSYFPHSLPVSILHHPVALTAGAPLTHASGSFSRLTNIPLDTLLSTDSPPGSATGGQFVSFHTQNTTHISAVSAWDNVQMSGTSATSHAQEQHQHHQYSLQQQVQDPTHAVQNINQQQFTDGTNSPLTPTAGYGAAEASAESSVSPRVAAVASASHARVNQACASCRRKKVRCDGMQPTCGNCLNRGMDCTYLAQKKRGRPPKSLQRQSAMPYFTPSSASAAPSSALLQHINDPCVSPGGTGLIQHPQNPPQQQQQQHQQHHAQNMRQQPHQHQQVPTAGSMQAYFGQWQHGSVTPALTMPHVGLGLTQAVPQSGLATAVSQATPGLLDLGGAQHTLFSGAIGSAATDTHSNDYFGTFPTSSCADEPPRAVDDLNLHSMGFALPPTMGAPPLLSVQPTYTTSVIGMGAPGNADHNRVRMVTSNDLPGNGLLFTDFVQHFMPLTEPPPVPPMLQQFQGRAGESVESNNFIVGGGGGPGISNALSSTLDSVAIAMTTHNPDSPCVQTTLDHLSHVTKSLGSGVSNEESISTDNILGPDTKNEDADASDAMLVHPSLLQFERRSGLASRAVHNYFCYIHPQSPIIHRPTFLRQTADGSVNHFVWFSLRALSARTLLHARLLSEAEVTDEEEHFASQARAALTEGLKRPSVEVVQGLALLSLYIFGTPRWQEASMYWCKATRLAQLMEFHVIDAPTRAIATKMHFGIFEPPTRRESIHRADLGLIPGDFSGHHVPLAQALTPLEAELRRRLWWTLFTKERFCAIAERLPTMVDEARMFVHFPCPAREWDQPEFTYQAPLRVPRYLREGYRRAEAGDDLNPLTLGQEMNMRKNDNLYMMCEIEYGFSMSHLVAFLADMGALFRPRAPYANEYIPVFTNVPWQDRMRALRANVERVERVLEMMRQDILQRLASAAVHHGAAPRPPPQSTTSNQGTGTGSGSNLSDPVLSSDTYAPGIEIPHLNQLTMLILYSVLNIHLYRMVFQIHYELSSSMPPVDRRLKEDTELLTAFDQYVKELWVRTTTAAQQVSRILRGEFPGVPHWVLTLAGIKKAADMNQTPGHASGGATASNPPVSMDVDSGSDSAMPQQSASHRLRSVFQERIKAQEAKLHEVSLSVFASFRRTLPYALLLAAKVHVDNIEWWTREHQDENTARAFLDLADIVRFLETHQTAFSSADYVSQVKGMMHLEVAVN